jgi:chondroitin 4-sulfotransferase 11
MDNSFMKMFLSEAKNNIVVRRDKLIREAKTIRNLHFDNFIFIHINKTGGSSVAKALNLNLQHKTALEKIAEVGQQKWDNSYTFAFVRNPWDKVVSHYHYRVLKNQTNLGTHPIDFREWVQLTYGQKNPQYYDQPKMFKPQSAWVANKDGVILVDFIGRFENLNEDFNTICQAIGKKVTLPHVKPSKRGNYRSYYDDVTTEIVAQWFRKDIDMFGYSF